MTATDNKISVVINTYNASLHLAKVLDSVKEFDEVVVCGKLVNYLGSLPETVQEKAYVVSINGTTTGIEEVTTDSDASDTPVYNLRGQRLTAPQKGINIIGGKKLVVK